MNPSLSQKMSLHPRPLKGGVLHSPARHLQSTVHVAGMPGCRAAPHAGRSTPRIQALQTPSSSTSSNGAGEPNFSWLYIELSVRDYELDQFAVVNNANYASYFQHAAKEFLNAKGIDTESLQACGQALAITSLNIKFLRPLKSRDRFRIYSRVIRLTPSRIIYEQQIVKMPRLDAANAHQNGHNGNGHSPLGSAPSDFPDTDLISTAEATCVCVDRDHSKVLKFDPSLKAKLLS